MNIKIKTADGNCEISLKQVTSEQAIRAITGLAQNVGNKHIIEDAGCGMTNVVVSVLGFDDAIMQCYPNGSYNDVWVLILKNGMNESITLTQLPYFLRKDLVERYAKKLGIECEIDQTY